VRAVRGWRNTFRSCAPSGSQLRPALDAALAELPAEQRHAVGARSPTLPARRLSRH
jgi:hypothetical protein